MTTSIAAQVKRRLEGMYTNILTLDDAMTFIYRGISDPSIWKCMQTRFDINSDGNIHDIYDGLNYVQHTVRVIIKVTFRFSSTIVTLCSVFYNMMIFMTLSYALTKAVNCATPFKPGFLLPHVIDTYRQNDDAAYFA